jgi:uncharacterized membrane protein
MTESLSELAAAVLVFVLSHILLSAPPVRGPLVARLGEWPFRGLYSLVAIVLIVWVAKAYNGAPVVDLWVPPLGLQHVSLTVMPLACILVVAGFLTRSPTSIGLQPPGATDRDLVAAGPVGILKVTRHPVMWGFALWALVHVLANGDAASLILFLGLGILALAGAAAIDGKKRLAMGSAWEDYSRRSSFVPLAALIAGRNRLAFREIGWWRVGLGLALYAVLLVFHGSLFGVSPLPF